MSHINDNPTWVSRWYAPSHTRTHTHTHTLTYTHTLNKTSWKIAAISNKPHLTLVSLSLSVSLSDTHTHTHTHAHTHIHTHAHSLRYLHTHSCICIHPQTWQEDELKSSNIKQASSYVRTHKTTAQTHTPPPQVPRATTIATPVAAVAPPGTSLP